MVYVANNESTGELPIGLARSFMDVPQQVSVRISGFEFPGEVIFAEQWQAWFGSSLPARTMFRLVLLSEYQRVDKADITERFIAVGIPSGRDQQSEASDFTQLNRELGRLDEIRKQYVDSGDYELHSLTASLTDNASKAQRDITETLAEQWRAGRLIATNREGSAAIQPDSIFVGDNPAAWIEAIAATMFTRPTGDTGSRSAQFDPEATFARILGVNESAWRPGLDNRVRLATGLGLDAIAEEIDVIAADNSKARVRGEELRALLLHHHGFPPGLASLLVVAYVAMRNGEASVSHREAGSNLRLDIHSLGTFVYDADLAYSLNWLSPGHAGDWNSALPYIRVLLPNAEPAESGVPDDGLARQFMQTLEVIGTRVTLTLHTLESVSGPAADRLPAVKLTKRLAPVLQSDDWESFYARARQVFPNVAQFSEAVAESSRLRVLSEDIVDVQAAHDYMATADFGRVDHGLAREALILLETVDVTAILESGAPAPAELQRFHSWKRLFTSAYMNRHAERRSADLELARRVKDADAQHSAIRKLAAIPELAGIYDPAFESKWGELRQRVQPCRNSDHEVELQRQPYCVDCGVRLGSSGHDDEVVERIAEIENMLHQSGNRLSEIAASRALSGEREDELRKLININSIADLTAVSHVLDDGVLSFLKRFASNSPGTTASSD